MSNITIAMNLHNLAISQYTGFDYDSFCSFNRKVLGSQEGGIHVLEQDEHDQGQIDAHLKTGYTDFGMPNQKRARSILLGGEADADIQVEISSDESNDTTHTITMDKDVLKLSGAKGHGVRTQKGRYYQFKIGNTQGKMFGIESLRIIPVVLHTKPRG
jgi:hypothetical protein